MKNIQCASMTFLKFKSFGHQSWGLFQLLRLKNKVRNVPEIEFFKLLGAGSGMGYRAWPKSGVIGLFVVWENFKTAQDFFLSEFLEKYSTICTEQFTVFLEPTSSRGTWSGFGNWRLEPQEKQEDGLVCALTRATIKKKYLVDFWKMVSPISKTQSEYQGLIFSQGIGEVPVLEQATFTMWENTRSMEEFAYTTFHGEAIHKVRQAKGFKEQMFTRFKPLMTFGTWEGKNILENYNIPELMLSEELAVQMVNIS